MNPKEKLVWNSMLDADLNKRYFERLSKSYFSRDKWAKIAIAITSSSSVASWWLLQQIVFEHLWQILSGITTLLAIALPILNWSEKMEASARLKGEYSNLLREYELLWMKISQTNADLVEEKMRELGKQESELALLEESLPTENKKWIIQIQKDVNRSRGL